MEKTKRVLAMIGVCVLVLCYVMSFITGITATESAHDWFIASIGATIFIPTVLYAYSILIRVTNQKNTEAKLREDAYLRQIKEQMKKTEADKKSEDGDNNTKN